MENNLQLQKMQRFSDLVKQTGWSLERLAWRLQDTLRYVEWKGKDVCEVGCGRGDMAIYLALNGARRVVGLEPSAGGSSPLHESVLLRRLDALQLNNLTFLPIRIEDYQFEPESFDLVFSINVVEHIYGTRLPLDEDPEAKAHHARVFRDIYNRMLRPGGYLVIANCSRESIWSFLGQYNIPALLPGTKTIGWEWHQKPEVWEALAKENGFEAVRVHWYVPYVLRSVPSIAGNRLFQYFTWASYIVTATKS